MLTRFPFDIQDDIKDLSHGLYHEVKNFSINSTNKLNEKIEKFYNAYDKFISEIDKSL